MKKMNRLIATLLILGSILTVVRLGSVVIDAHRASEVVDFVVAEGNYSSLQSEQYTVKAGDSVTSIARDFVLRYALHEPDYELAIRIQKDNNLDDYHLDIGQVITVRYWD